jgi:uncharacterized protein YjiS (DUF1127 family)
MTTMDIGATFGRPTPRIALAVPGFIRTLIRRRRERRLFALLSRLPPHLIRDVGFDPEEVYDAVEGTWYEINPGRYRNR